MSQRFEDNDDSCPSCNGRGWKVRRVHRLLVARIIGGGPAASSRQTCPDCQGSGRVIEVPGQSADDEVTSADDGLLP